jgi:phosphoribosyl 1,2-cyclic phosphate phosphodiesterase
MADADHFSRHGHIARRAHHRLLLDDYAHCPHHLCQRALSDPRLRRTRSSIWIQAGDAGLLVDTSQDFREQVLAQGVRRIDAVLYTHAHADHIYGLPDLRSHCRHQGGAIPIYGSGETLDTLRGAFHYIFEPPEFVGGGIPASPRASGDATNSSQGSQ